jgi:cytochrome P450
MLLGGAERLRAVVVEAVGSRSDVLTAIARSHSMRLVCAALGVPRRDWGLHSRWSEDSADPRSLDLLGAYVDVMIAERCRKSTDDLISNLISIGAVAASSPRTNCARPSSR